jgi:hypothetical protein
VVEQGLFHLARRDLFTAPVNQLFQPAGDKEVLIFVQVAPVAR